MHEVIAEVAGNLIPVDVSVSAGEAIPVEVGGGSGGGGGGLSNAAKDALLQIARKVVYVDAGGATYYNALYEALYPLASISAVYTQSGTIYDTDTLDDLIPDLVVTATYGDGGTATISSTDYTLSGTLAVGTSTVTVTYEGKTATFTVTVSAEPATLSSITAVYTQSGTVYDTDSLDSLKTDLVVTAHYSDSSSETVAAADYTLSGTLTAGTSTVTVTYQGKTDTFDVTVTASVTVNGWFFEFNDSLLSSGTKELGFSGVEKYVTGYDGKAYYHEVDPEGGAATGDKLGIKTTSPTDVPDLSGDWTLCFWYKSLTNLRGHPFQAVEYMGTTSATTLANPTNIKGGWLVNRGNAATSAVGITICFISQRLTFKILNLTGTYGATYTITCPNSFDSTVWHHYAVTQSRTDGKIYFFIDGNVIFDIVTGTTVLFGDHVCIGNLFGAAIDTQDTLTATSYGDIIDDLYINDTTCKWTSDFNPSTITY